MKKILKFPVFVLAFALAILSAFAFSMPVSHNANKLPTVYYFDPLAANTYSQLVQPSNWTVSGTSCISTGIDICTMKYTGTRAQFDNHISNDFANKTQFLAAADTKKN